MKNSLKITLCFLIIGCKTTKNTTINKLNNKQLEHHELSATIDKVLTMAKVSGIGVSVFQEKDVFVKTFGVKNQKTSEKLNSKTAFLGASLSKAIFAYIVARLVLDGKIDLDKPLQNYLDFPLPDLKKDKKRQSYANLKNDERYKQLTARMCLNHTTGFPNWRWMTRENDFIPEGKIRFLIEPGTRYYYSGEGIQLLQFVIEELTDLPLEQLAQKYVFEPLKMNSTSYVWQEAFASNFAVGHNKKSIAMDFRKRTEANAAGSLITTLEDYSKFLQHLLGLFQKKSPVTKLLFAPTIRIKSKTQFGYQAWEYTSDNDDIDLSYGLGFGLLNTPYGKAIFKEGHDNGFQHYFILFVEKQKGILLMSNSDNAESTFKELLEVSIGDVYTPWQWQRYIPYD